MFLQLILIPFTRPARHDLFSVGQKSIYVEYASERTWNERESEVNARKNTQRSLSFKLDMHIFFILSLYHGNNPRERKWQKQYNKFDVW